MRWNFSNFPNSTLSCSCILCAVTSIVRIYNLSDCNILLRKKHGYSSSLWTFKHVRNQNKCWSFHHLSSCGLDWIFPTLECISPWSNFTVRLESYRNPLRGLGITYWSLWSHSGWGHWYSSRGMSLVRTSNPQYCRSKGFFKGRGPNSNNTMGDSITVIATTMESSFHFSQEIHHLWR